MNLAEIENLLVYYRKDLNLKLIKVKRNSLHLSVLEMVENGGNYKLPSLLTYIDAIGFELEANGMPIRNTIELGNFLRTNRERCNQTKSEIRWEGNRGFREINKLEAGGGSRSNLINYLEKLKIEVDFKLIDKYGIAREREKEKETEGNQR